MIQYDAVMRMAAVLEARREQSSEGTRLRTAGSRYRDPDITGVSLPHNCLSRMDELWRAEDCGRNMAVCIASESSVACQPFLVGGEV